LYSKGRGNMRESEIKHICENCSYYLKSECPRHYYEDRVMWRRQSACEIFHPKGSKDGINEVGAYFQKRPNGESTRQFKEPTMPETIVNLLDSMIKLLKLAEKEAKPAVTSSLLTLFGDPITAMWQDQRKKDTVERCEKEVLPKLEGLYNIYPSQVGKTLIENGLVTYYNMLSTICPKCQSTIPKGRVNDCPFCKEGEKEREDRLSLEDPLKILKTRYAKGEITKVEYEEMKKTLES
jgi:hypothetical protein